MIEPKVGRGVFYAPVNDNIANGGHMLPALIVHVWNDRMVNLVVFDANGHPHSRTSIQLLQDDDEAIGASYAAWHPEEDEDAAQLALELDAVKSVADELSAPKTKGR